MSRTATKLATKPRPPRPTTTAEERLRIWERAEGVWKNRKPDPVKELQKIRKEWERKPA